MKPLLFLRLSLFVGIVSSLTGADHSVPMNRADFKIRDPFVVADKLSQTYFMYASITDDTGGIPRRGVGVYKSKDLQVWEGPTTVFRIPDGFWADQAVWAPEVHGYNGKYYLFVTLASRDILPTPPKRRQNIKRQSQILVSDSLEGPFKPFNNYGHTPDDWMSLDGTLWVEDDTPYMIFCHEWWQITDGSVELVELASDLSRPVSEPKTLFYATEGPWVRSLKQVSRTPEKAQHGFITDGCFLYRTKTGQLLMIWSSFGEKRYTIGIARSTSGKVAGPWIQDPMPLFAKDGGHGMIFRDFEGNLRLPLHQPNGVNERVHFFEIEDTGDSLKILGELPFTKPLPVTPER
jgi:arabinan endo-1,5-alpha-L-arabinosidase